MKTHTLPKTTLLLLFTLSISHAAEDPALARLSFHLRPQHMSAFEAAYPTQIEPLLKQHGLIMYPIQPRTTPDSTFSRLFIVQHPSAIDQTWQKLAQDQAFKKTFFKLNGSAFRNLFSRMNYAFSCEAYSIPTRFGKTVQAGPGKTQIATPGKGVWHTYREPDGLAGVEIYAIYQDQNNTFWFATQKGVSRYDGFEWTTFTTQVGKGYNRVRTILEDQEGHFWFGTHGGGVSRFDPKTDAWTTFTTKNGLSANSISPHAMIQDSKGYIWIGTYDGVSRFDPKTDAWTIFTTKDGLAFNRVCAIFEDSNHHLWFGTYGGGISRFDPKADANAWTTWTTKDGLAHNKVRAIFEDENGHFWFGTAGGGVNRFDPLATSNAWTNWTTKDGLTHNIAREIMKDKNGHFWFGTNGGGVSRFDPLAKSNAWTSWTTKDALSGDRVWSIIEDHNNHIWFGTLTGVSRYDNSDWATFTTENGLAHNIVRAILEDRKGQLWFGTHKGISRYNGSTFTTWTTQEGLGNNQINTLLEDRKGHIWLGTENGVTRYDGATFTTFTPNEGLAGTSVRAMVEDNNGDLWFGTTNGVSRYNGKTFTTFNLADGLVNKLINAMFKDRDGHIWFGTNGGGIGRYDGKNFTAFALQDRVEGWLQGGVVYAISQDQAGNLWFAGQGALCKYDGQTWKVFHKQEALGGTGKAILQDKKGHMWFGTTGGISRYDGKVFQKLITPDGLPSNLIYAVHQDQKGDFWFGTHNGVTRYRPPPQTSPPLLIDVAVADQRYANPESIQFPNTVPLLSFEFHALSSKTRPEAMVYRYRLHNYEEEWHTTHKHRVEYETPQTGSYTFEIQAIDRDLTYSKRATVTLIVEPPFYFQTRFFIPVAGGGTLLLAILIFQAVSLLQRRRQVTRYQQAAVAELGDARDVQLSLLPTSPPQIEGFDIAGLCEPATEVGGDYFTYCHLNGTDDSLSIVLMDVTGHGMRAATTTFLANGMLQSEIRNQQSPAEVFTQMHQSLKSVLPKRSFVAAALAHITLKSRTLTHYNAGIPEPILWRNGQPIPIKIHNTRPLGGPLTPNFASTSTQLQSGDRILLFTDGLTEASNHEGKMYGEERLPTLLTSLSPKEENAQTWITTIQQDVQAFVDSTELQDDLTIVGIRVL